MIELLPEINKEFILSKVTQEEIFEKYLGCKVVPGEKYRSPLRDDNHPTCSIKRLASGILWFKDWSGHFAGDCFSLVGKMYNCNYYIACKIIARDMNLVKGLTINTRKKPKQKIYEEKERAEIKVKWKQLSPDDEYYWRNHGITNNVLKYYNVSAVSYVWLDGRLVYMYSKKDPCYGYWFGKQDIKVYFPLREEFRFLGNSTKIQGYQQLPKTGDLLIITKSLKDVMFLYSIGIAAIAPQSETAVLQEDIINEFKNRFKKVICIYDFDLAGIRTANKMRKLYDIDIKFFTNGRFNTPDCLGKDVTDICKNISKEDAIMVTHSLLKSNTWYVEDLDICPF